MPRVPTLDGPQVTLQGIPSARVGGPVPAAAFGDGGRGAQEAANAFGGLSQAALGFADRQIDAMREENVAEANEAWAQVQQRANDLLYNPETGYFNTQGRNAYEGAGGAQDALAQAFQEVSGSLGREEARRLLGEQWTRAQPGYQSSIQRHASQGLEVWQQSSLDARVAAATDTLSLNYSDPDAVSQSLTDIQLATVGQGQRLGLSDQEIAANVRQRTSGALRGAVDRMLANGQDRQALAFIDANRGRMTGDDLAVVERATLARRQQAEDQRIAASITSGAVPVSPDRVMSGPAPAVRATPQRFEVEGLEIEPRFNPDFHFSRSATANAEPFRGIALHWTGSPDAGAVADYGNTVDAGRGGAFGYHFIVAQDGRVIQAAPMDKRTNHIGGEANDANPDFAEFSNRDTIGISLAGQGQATPEQEAAVRRLAQSLASEYGIDLGTSVFGHGEIAEPGHRDPEEGYLAALIRQDAAGMTGTAAPVEPVEAVALPRTFDEILANPVIEGASARVNQAVETAAAAAPGGPAYGAAEAALQRKFLEDLARLGEADLAPDQRGRVLDILTQQHEQQVQALEAAREVAMNDAYAAIEQGVPPGQLPSALTEVLSRDDRDALESAWESGMNPTTDPVLFTRLIDPRQTSTQQLADFDLIGHRSQLSRSDYGIIEDLRNQARAELGRDTDTNQPTGSSPYARTIPQRITSVMERAGLIGRDARNGVTAQEQATLEAEIYRSLRAASEQKGGPLTQPEEDAIIGRLFLNYEWQETGFFGGVRTNSQPLYEVDDVNDLSDADMQATRDAVLEMYPAAAGMGEDQLNDLIVEEFRRSQMLRAAGIT